MVEKKTICEKVCEKEGHSYFVVKYWFRNQKREAEYKTYVTPYPQDWYVLMVCTKCGELVIKRAGTSE